MSLYTIIVDYKGGTYIEQCRAKGVRHAIKKYAQIIIKSEYLPGKKLSRAIMKDLQDFPPVPLDGLTSAWCCTPSVGNHMALINIVKTKT